jgi:hypothetical protein
VNAVSLTEMPVNNCRQIAEEVICFVNFAREKNDSLFAAGRG